MNKDKVSIVIVSWNVKELVLDCINSIYNNEYLGEIEIIVVDNNSNDGTIGEIQEKFSKVITIHNKTNLGFAKANNQGFKVASGKYVYILNPDTILPPNNLFHLVDILNSDKTIGMACPKVLLGDGNIQKTCARKYPGLLKILLIDTFQLNKIPVLGNYLDETIRFPYDYNSEGQNIKAGVGAAMIVRKEVLFEAGLFHEGFLHGGEDNYLCYRINEKKNKIRYTAKTHVIHFTAESVKKAPVRSTVNSILSHGLFIKLKSGDFSYWIYMFIIRFIYVPTRMVKLLMFKNNLSDKENQKTVLRQLFKWKAIH